MNTNSIKLIFSFSLIIFLYSGFAFSQDSIMIAKPKFNKAQFRDLFAQGNMMINENFNDTALGTFLVLHDWEPDNANVNFKIGQLYLASSSQKPKAVAYLEAALPKASRSYTPDDPTEKHCPELVYFLLAKAYHLTYRFDEATAMFEKFSKCTGDMTLQNDIKRRIEICQTAKMYVSSPMKCTITNLGDSVNTRFPEYGAVITADESTMYFTSRRFNSETGGNDNRDIYDKYYEDIWVSNRKDDGTWSEAKPVSTHINGWYDEAVVGISADGQQMFYYKDDKNDKEGSIYYSKLEGDKWSYGYKLGTDAGDITDINTQHHEPSACIAPDGNTLYFVSDRPGGYGGEDIYKCIKLPNGRWSKATNLGPTINSKYDEDAPFMHPDGVTLFFSSNGNKTMGGFDIFFAVKSDSGWYPPQSMGYPINTTDDDIFYVMSTDGKRAYFSSLRPEGKGEKDLYLITIPQRIVTPVSLLKGYISFVGKDSMLSYVTISAIDVESGNIVQEVHPNSRTMKYILPLNPGRSGRTYSLTYEADGYRPHKETLTVSPEGEYKEIDKNFDFKNVGSISVYGKVSTRTAQSGLNSVKISVKDNVSKKLVGVYNVKSDGTYAFDLSGKGGESYALTYETSGFLTMNESIEVPKTLTEFDFKKDVVMETSVMLGTISVIGSLTDKDKLPIRKSRIVVIDNKTEKTVGTYTPDEKGEYYFNLQRGIDYNVSYEADGYLFQSENINVPKDKTYSEITKDVILGKITKGAKIVLNNIFFDSGKANLRKESNVELDKLFKLINEQQNIKVEVGGHTDDAGDLYANNKLSQERADAVVNYLIIKGVDRLKVASQGYGQAQPIAPNKINGKPNPKGMQLNRRVEFKVLDN